MINQLEEGSNLDIQFDKRGGLVPVAVQDVESKKVLMVAYANREALETTLETGLATFWSTSRGEIWTKGKTSGDYLEIQDIYTDCDQDALVYIVKLKGNGVCHTTGPDNKHRLACFYRKLDLENKVLKFDTNTD